MKKFAKGVAFKLAVVIMLPLVMSVRCEVDVSETEAIALRYCAVL